MCLGSCDFGCGSVFGHDAIFPRPWVQVSFCAEPLSTPSSCLGQQTRIHFCQPVYLSITLSHPLSLSLRSCPRVLISCSPDMHVSHHHGPGLCITGLACECRTEILYGFRFQALGSEGSGLYVGRFQGHCHWGSDAVSSSARASPGAGLRPCA